MNNKEPTPTRVPAPLHSTLPPSQPQHIRSNPPPPPPHQITENKTRHPQRLPFIRYNTHTRIHTLVPMPNTWPCYRRYQNMETPVLVSQYAVMLSVAGLQCLRDPLCSVVCYYTQRRSSQLTMYFFMLTRPGPWLTHTGPPTVARNETASRY